MTYADDVFSAYTYDGTNSAQNIVNGIDLTQGGMVWIKSRAGAFNNSLFSTNLGVERAIYSNGTTGVAGPYGGYGVTTFNSDGYSLGGTYPDDTSKIATTYTSWTFRKAPKFFDVVSYTGTGLPQTINHSLSVVPGMIMIKAIDQDMGWVVYHRSLGAGWRLVLNSTTEAVNDTSVWNNTVPTSTTFSIGNFVANNTSGKHYVAYIFAHDTSTDGIIQCGGYTNNSSAPVDISLGFEPQYVLVKNVTVATNWVVFDAMRGLNNTSSKMLNPNLADIESDSTAIRPTATGFKVINGIDQQLNSGATTGTISYIYCAIRRPNKPPTSGLQVYNAITRTGNGTATGVTGVGFAPDAWFATERSATIQGAKSWWDRTRGTSVSLRSNSTTNESSLTDVVSLTAFGMDGISVGIDNQQNSINYSAKDYINYAFRRAP